MTTCCGVSDLTSERGGDRFAPDPLQSVCTTRRVHTPCARITWIAGRLLKLPLWSIVGLLLPVFAACQVNAIHHDEDRAAAEAAEVLKLIYLKADYEKAHARLEKELREKLSAGQLRDLVGQVEAGQGPVQELRLDSFLPMQGQRAMTVFFDGTNERGRTYHQVVLIGDAGSYKVGGIWVRGDPYPAEKLRQPFRQGVVVKRE